MSEKKLNAEFQKKFDKLNELINKHKEKPQDDFDKDLKEIRQVIEMLNNATEQDREYLALHLLQPFVLQMDDISDKKAKFDFFKSIFGGLDPQIIKTVLFERSPASPEGILPFELLTRRGVDAQALEFLTERYPDWVNVRKKWNADANRYDYIHNKKVSVPPGPGEYFLIFTALNPGDYSPAFARVLLEQGANLSVKEPPYKDQQPLTPLEVFDEISPMLKSNHYALSPTKFADEEISQMRTRIVAAMDAQQQKAMRAGGTKESLGNLRKGQEQYALFPEDILSHITEYTGDTPVEESKREREERDRKRMEKDYDAQQEAEKASGKKPKKGSPGGLEEEGPKGPDRP